MLWIVQFIAWDLSACFATNAFLFYIFLTDHAVTCMTLLDALMLSTWQKAFTEIITCWDFFSAMFPLSTKEILNSFVTTRTE